MDVIAFGVDPGTRQLGWGVVQRDGSRLLHVAHGVVSLDPARPLAERLGRLATELEQLVAAQRPDVGSVESIFYAKDAQAAAKLGHARGVVLSCMARAGLPVAEYAPARVKRTLTGRGLAGKPQVAQMVRALLGLRELPALDAADALALAITHLRLAHLPPGLAAPRRRRRGLPPALAQRLRLR